MDIEFLNIT